MRRGYALALAAALLLAGLGVTARVSASALPGEPLYGVKRAVEAVRQALVTGDAARQALDGALAERRRFEARELQRLGRTAEVEFDGIVEDTADGVDDGRGVQVPAAVLTGPAPLGQTVWVRVQSRPGLWRCKSAQEASAPAEPLPHRRAGPAQGVGRSQRCRPASTGRAGWPRVYANAPG